MSLVIVCSVALMTFVYIRNNTQFETSIKKEKINEVNLLGAHVTAKIEELRNDVMFLSSTPPIQGIIRATLNKGIDPIDKSTAKQWKDRLSTIFREMLYAKSDYDQIRFIGYQNKGCLLYTSPSPRDV